jgi:uroporphyrinogen-III synthase
VNGVGALTRALARRGDRWPAARARIAAIGAKTAAALGREGRSPDLVPDAFTSEALAEAFPAGQGRVLLARADIAPTGLEHALAAKGWRPHRMAAYRTRTVALSEEVLLALAAGDVDAITFASASSVDGFVAGLGEAPEWPPAVCIGPVTAAAARRHRIPVGAVATPHTIEGLVAALEALFATARSGGRPGPR